MKEIKRKDLVECPNCKGEAYIITTSQQLLTFGIICILSFGVAMCIPVLGWILAPIFILMAIVSFISSAIAAISGKASITCKDCKAKFKLDKEEYKKYKAN
ncbi:MAG: hypothetical protein ACRCX8_13890 [Sarcina sp.]